MSEDRQLIESLGGPAKVADLLGYDKAGGVQRVYNWMVRGIPSRVKLDHPEIFLRTLQKDASPSQDISAEPLAGEAA